MDQERTTASHNNERDEEKKIIRLLSQVEDLHDKGMLNDSTYEAKKLELISRLHSISQSKIQEEEAKPFETQRNTILRTDYQEEKPNKMALIKCPECGREVSNKAPQCIHCGYPLNTPISTPKHKFDNQNYNSRRFREINEKNSDEPQTQSALKAFITGGLRKCPTCGKAIAQNAKRCPHCGRRDPFWFSHAIYYIIVIIIIIAVFSSFSGRR